MRQSVTVLHFRCMTMRVLGTGNRLIATGCRDAEVEANCRTMVQKRLSWCFGKIWRVDRWASPWLGRGGQGVG
jgi:hypothetical protein